jgi:D-alanine transaminase
MARIIYVNGRYQNREEAAVHVEDRGYLFADGVYDAFELRDGRIIDMERHLDRLFWSMSEIAIGNIPGKRTFEHILRETVRRNGYRNGFIYMQVTRGVASREFPFPSDDTPASIICIVYNTVSGAMDRLAANGINVITCRDERWKRPDIKTILLLPSVLARQEAREKGAFEAWLLDEGGFVTEGAASNAWIISRDNELITRQRDQSILAGITRKAVLELVEKEDLKLVERPFSKEEVFEAEEAFITACSITVMPVVKIDGSPIGGGKPGKKTLLLREIYRNRM